MAVWDYGDAVRACVLAQLCRAGEWTPPDSVAQALGLPPAMAEAALRELTQNGCAEQCPWPLDGRMTEHYRCTAFGRCLDESNRAQWTRDREVLDRLLLGEAPVPQA